MEKIIQTVCSSRFCDLTPHQIVPILAEEGVYLGSPSTYYRIMREAGLLKHRGKGKKPRRHKPIELKATGPGQLLSWDITYLKTGVRGSFYYLYMVIDVWSRVILGWDVHSEESGELGKELFKRICGEFDLRKAILHSDNGGPMRSGTMAAALEKLGVIQSFSRPNVSNDNAYSESLFKTLKLTAGYPRCFKEIEEARVWVKKFVTWYNNEHRHSGIGYVTPMQRHTGEDIEIFARREKTYEGAREKHPERWAKESRRWTKQPEVILKKGNRKKSKKKRA